MKEAIQPYSDWKWLKSRRVYSNKINKDLEVVINPTLSFNESCGNFEPYLQVHCKSIRQLYQKYLPPGLCVFYWAQNVGDYYGDYADFSVWRHNGLELGLNWFKNWYTVEELPKIIDKVIVRSMNIIDSEIALSSEGAFFDSILVEEGDERFTVKYLQENIEMQCMIRLLRGDFEFLEDILHDRIPALKGIGNNGSHMELLMKKIPQIKADYQSTGSVI